jgi:hypothetical protein
LSPRDIARDHAHACGEAAVPHWETPSDGVCTSAFLRSSISMRQRELSSIGRNLKF